MNEVYLVITPEAKKYLEKIVPSEKSLKIDLKPSGCSGYSYKLTVEGHENKTHIFHGINFSLSSDSLNFLNNSIIDYQKEGLNKKLVINSPQAQNHCGCGESFSLK